MARVVVEAARMGSLGDLPGMSQGRVELTIAAVDRESAAAFVDALHESGGPAVA